MGSDVDTLAAEGRLRAGTRLVGIDAARALAFGGMLLAHFAATRRPRDPGWLRAVDNAADGRSAPLFCLLLGVGAGLLARRGTSDLAFVRRGLVLFAVGLLVWPLVDRVYLILPHYGLL
ncbi:MAG TPA: heparan-alpha-glucosaminide N-acetyltransferase domain-containing protein, partial [Acidimicrobiales bacterium]|nr:heparan-alpha-glucosaminide N-acetyltransferase domain-containing protein [Acidimicrobiales bacterium]